MTTKTKIISILGSAAMIGMTTLAVAPSAHAGVWEDAIVIVGCDRSGGGMSSEPDATIRCNHR